MSDLVRSLLGLGSEAEDLGVLQMVVRAAVVYAVALIIIRCGKKRALGEATPFDVVTVIVIGSIASRAVTGNAPFGPALAACATFVALHWLLAATAIRWNVIERWIKGSNRLLVQDGRILDGAVRASALSLSDIEEAMRARGIRCLDEIREARLKRSGQISFIKTEQ
ncbi:DUF421 domain-containing protein [Sphingomonas aliaeris]|uniref:DUF421 domain-containing protein n=1 Tax=Sphingomonas aliaeris TaxID=2759526 RepID=A0A974NW85_9SPHN|nr:YetF domain-containing protein [Sphingomonas aliaeris]QQV77963.1 DUF421 domain-containing protein [Sphingomonas aliaeris]